MKLILAETRLLKDSISIISELVSEGSFVFDKEGLKLIAMDPANVAMVIFRCPSSAFIEYHIEDPEFLTLDLSRVKQILKRAKSSDVLEFTRNKNKLQITFKGAAEKNFFLSILDTDEKEQKVPSLTFPIKINMPSAEFADAISDVGIASESVSLIADENKLMINAEGDSTQASIEIRKGENISLVSDTQDKIKAKYSIEYLKKFVDSSKLSDVVQIQFNNDYPLMLNYTVKDKLQIGFILAPRVEND